MSREGSRKEALTTIRSLFVLPSPDPSFILALLCTTFCCSCPAANFKSREDHRKQIELEEARKAGLAPAELDEDGKEINPHIPQYMSSAPWYLNASAPVSHPRPCIVLAPEAGLYCASQAPIS